MSTLLNCFQAEIGLSPFDQPDSDVGSQCWFIIYLANLFSHSALPLDFSSVIYIFFNVLQQLHIMAELCLYFHSKAMAGVSKRRQRTVRANTGCQNLVPESGSDAFD